MWAALTSEQAAGGDRPDRRLTGRRPFARRRGERRRKTEPGAGTADESRQPREEPRRPAGPCALLSGAKSAVTPQATRTMERVEAAAAMCRSCLTGHPPNVEPRRNHAPIRKSRSGRGPMRQRRSRSCNSCPGESRKGSRTPEGIQRQRPPDPRRAQPGNLWDRPGHQERRGQPAQQRDTQPLEGQRLCARCDAEHDLRGGHSLSWPRSGRSRPIVPATVRRTSRSRPRCPPDYPCTSTSRSQAAGAARVATVTPSSLGRSTSGRRSRRIPEDPSGAACSDRGLTGGILAITS